MSRDDFAPAANPFSARHIRPGAIAYRFPPGESGKAIVDRLRQAGWRGQVIGPHGSGKSTLLAAILPLIERAGMAVLLVELHDGERMLPIRLDRTHVAPPAVVVVDGYEQLSLWSRIRLTWYCRRKGLGLLVTTHRPLGLPILLRTQVDTGVASQIVGELLGIEAGLVDKVEVSRRLERHGGNLREVLFDLYDWYEDHRRSEGRNQEGDTRANNSLCE